MRKTVYRDAGRENRRRSLQGAMLCLLPLLLTGCGQREMANQKQQIRIGVSLYDRYDTFLMEYMDILEAELAEQKAEGQEEITIDIYDAVGSQLTQNDQVAEMIQNGCDVLCINLVDRTAPLQVIDAAKRSNVPVIFFNRELVEEDLMQWNQLYYVGANAEESGRMEGELAAADILSDTAMLSDPATGKTISFSLADRNRDGVIQYVVLEGEAGHQDTIIRTEASVKALTDAGIQVEKLGYGIANWNRAEAQNRMKQLYAAYGDEIELVLCNNDDMALGAIDAYNAAAVDTAERPLIYGIDGTQTGLEAVQHGSLTATVYNDKEGQARAVCALALQLCRGESLEDLPLENGKYIRLPYQKVRKDNVKDFLG